MTAASSDDPHQLSAMHNSGKLPCLKTHSTCLRLCDVRPIVTLPVPEGGYNYQFSDGHVNGYDLKATILPPMCLTCLRLVRICCCLFPCYRRNLPHGWHRYARLESRFGTNHRNGLVVDYEFPYPGDTSRRMLSLAGPAISLCSAASLRIPSLLSQNWDPRKDLQVGSRERT